MEMKKMNLDIGYESTELIDFLINAGNEYDVMYRFENDGSSSSSNIFFCPNITFFGTEENLKKLYIEEFEPDYDGNFSEIIN